MHTCVCVCAHVLLTRRPCLCRPFHVRKCAPVECLFRRIHVMTRAALGLQYTRPVVRQVKNYVVAEDVFIVGAYGAALDILDT